MSSPADRLSDWLPLVCAAVLVAVGVALQGWWIAPFAAGTAVLLFAVHWFWPTDDDEQPASQREPAGPQWPEHERVASEVAKVLVRGVIATAVGVGFALAASRWFDHAAFPALAGGLIATSAVRLIRDRRTRRADPSVAGL